MAPARFSAHDTGRNGVVAEIVDIVADVDLHAVAFDRWRIDVFKKEMERLGVELPLTPWGGRASRICPRRWIRWKPSY
jgi:hypothetical protein